MFFAAVALTAIAQQQPGGVTAALGQSVLDVAASGSKVFPVSDMLENAFRHPPQSARLRAYAWHWIQGHITKEGITVDLDNMAKAGFAGAIIYHGGNRKWEVESRTGAFIQEIGPVWDYLSKEHLDMIRHAADEARRLGLQLGMHAGAGWSGSGGPWIKPKHAMKTILIREDKVKGGTTYRFTRPTYDPDSGQGFVGLVAFKIPPAELASGKPVVLPAKDAKRGANADLWKHMSANPKEDLIPFAAAEKIPPNAVIAHNEVLNLTPLIGTDGVLTWKAPEGQWVVLVATYGPALYNVQEMAMPSGVGLDCDHLDPAALECHWEYGIKPVLDRLEDHVGTTFRYIQLDSHETGNHTWGKNLPELFRRLHGYDLVPWLPALSGRVVGSTERTERFLRDYRKALEVGWNEAFAATMAKKCREHGLQFVAQPYDRGTFGCFSFGAAVDVVQCEFWIGGGSGIHRPNPNRRNPQIVPMASIAHTTGKNLLTAESFTSYLSHYNAERTLTIIKLCGDSAWCDGVNALWTHEVPLNPYPHLRPGMYFGIWGVNFNPNAWPCRDQMRVWTDYVQRAQALLQAGRYVADFLVHDPSELAVTMPLEFPFGYRYDLGNDDILLQLRVKDGRLCLPSGMEYRCLILPYDCEHFNYRRHVPEVLSHIATLVSEGAQVLGPKPLGAWTLKDEVQADRIIKELSDTLWKGFREGAKGSHVFGKGQVWWGYSPDEWARQVGLAPDFVRDRAAKAKLEFIHRRANSTNADWYFVANPDPFLPYDAEAVFRVTGRVPEFFGPVSGQTQQAPVWQETSGQTRVGLQLAPAGSVFVVFRKPAAGLDQLVAFQSVKPFSGVVDSRAIVLKDGKPGVLAFDTGRYAGRTKSGKQITTEVTVPSPLTLDSLWTLKFDPELGGPAEPIVFDKLTSWHEHPDPKIKYYSGPVSYRKTVAIPAELVVPGRRLMLDLGRVIDLAEVRLNGRTVAVAWCPPFAVDVTAAAKAGKNDLELIVVNGWRNRWIGDEQLTPDVETVNPSFASPKARSPIKFPDWAKQGRKSPNGRILFSTFMPFKKDDPLEPAGLLGPVVLRCGVIAEMK